MIRNFAYYTGLILSGLAISPVSAQEAGVDNHSASAISFSNQQIAHQIIDLSFPKENRSDYMAATMAAIADQIRNAALGADRNIDDPALIGIVDRHLNKMLGDILDDFNDNSDGLFEAMETAYAEEFSSDELVAIRNFVATPAGAEFIKRSPNILANPEVAGWNQKFFQRIQAKEGRWLKDLLNEMTEYLKKSKEEQL